MKRTSNIDKAQCSIYFTRFHQTINILDEDIKCVEIKPDITLGVRLTAGWQTRQRQDADSSCAVVTWGMVATCNCGRARLWTLWTTTNRPIYICTQLTSPTLCTLCGHVWPLDTTMATIARQHRIRTRRHYGGWTQCTVFPDHRIHQMCCVCRNISLVVWALFRCSLVSKTV